MNQKIRIKNSQECAVIDIEGTIGVPEQWQFDDPQQRVATYESFRRSIASIEELKSPRVVVNIRSTGGDVGDALLIYDALVALDAEVTTRCWGYVASAATVIAQAASEGCREISPNALYLIHASTSAAEGNASELTQRAELLRKSDATLAEIYARRSGREAEHFAELMSQEAGAGVWLTSKETIEAGLADAEIVGGDTTERPIAEKVGETLTGALSSVKGLIRRLGAQIGGLEVGDASASSGSAASASAASESASESASGVGVSDLAASVDAQSAASLIAFGEQQRMLRPTDVPKFEDPSLHESQMSANESAYARDARRLRG